MRWWGPGTRSSALVTMFTTAKHKVIHRQSGAGVMYDAGADVVTTTIQTNKPTLLWYLIVTTNTWWRVFSLSLTSNSRANTLSDISQQYNIVHLKNILVWRIFKMSASNKNNIPALACQDFRILLKIISGQIHRYDRSDEGEKVSSMSRSGIPASTLSTWSTAYFEHNSAPGTGWPCCSWVEFSWWNYYIFTRDDEFQ